MPTTGDAGLTAAELADMAAEAALYFDQSVTIQRAVKTSDGAGHTAKTWPTLATVKGSMGVPSGAYMSEIAARLSDTALWTVTLPQGTDVQRDDRLVIGSETLTVQHVMAPASYAFTVQVLAAEVR